MVRLLRQCDAQMFFGFQSYDAVSDLSVLEGICRVADCIGELVQGNKGKGAKNLIVFSGCGTSGRIGWLASLSFNRLVESLGENPCFEYLISGGDESLVISNELPEDDPLQGAKDLELATKQASSVLFIGITCGLSAPYVAGQIDFAMKQPNFATVLMGFNPVALSRNEKMDKWDRTCKQVFCELNEMSKGRPDRAFVLNPVVGPEAVTGSSRMKGGSMTKILLDTVSLLGVSWGYGIPMDVLLEGSRGRGCKDLPVDRERVLPDQSSMGEGEQKGVPHCGVTPHDVMNILSLYQNTMYHVYSGSLAEGTARLISMAGEALCSPNGHLYLVGSGSFGLVSLIDASEMVDTYGAELSEVKAFVQNGWSACKATSGDLAHKGQLFHISLEEFTDEVLPGLSCADMVLVVSDTRVPVDREFVNRLLSTPAQSALVEVSSAGENMTRNIDKRWKAIVVVNLPHYSIKGEVPIFADFAVKLVLNAVTTCANVLKGRVYGNTMINLTVANSKLFHRAVEIVQKVTKTDRGFAEECLKLSIVRNEVELAWTLSLEELIQKATTTKLVIPMAILLATQGKGFQEGSTTWREALGNGNPLTKGAIKYARDKIETILTGQKVTMKSLMINN